MTTINDILASQNDTERTATLSHYLSGVAKLHKKGNQASINIKYHGSDIGAFDVIAETSHKTQLDNLTDCLTQLYPRYDRYLPTAFSGYNTNSTHQPDLRTIEKQVYKKRKHREKALKTCFETNATFQTDKSWHRFQVINKQYDSSALQQLLANPDEAIAKGKFYKDCAATTVSLYTMADGKKVIIKRYNSKGTLYSLTRSLISSRARVCWKGALLLKQIGINTPDNLAMLECRTGPWIKTSYLITEFVEGTTLAEAFIEGADQSQWGTTAREVGDILHSFPPVQVAHGDFKSRNFIVANDTVLMIDLDSMKSHTLSTIFNSTYQRDVDRFERNWQTDPSAKTLFAPLISALRASTT